MKKIICTAVAICALLLITACGKDTKISISDFETSTISDISSAETDISGIWIMSSDCGNLAGTAFGLNDMGDGGYMGTADFDTRPNSSPFGIRLYYKSDKAFTGSLFYSDGGGNICDESCEVSIIDNKHITISCSLFSGTAIKE